MEVWLVWEIVETNAHVPLMNKLIGAFSSEKLAMDFVKKQDYINNKAAHYTRRLPVDYLT